MKLFFSHNTDDEAVVQQLVNLLHETNGEWQPFYSSDPHTGVTAGEGILSRINQEICQCHKFVAIITESYVRSQYCMYELSVAAFLRAQGQLDIIPIVSNKEIYDRVNSILAQFDLLYIEAGAPKANDIFRQAFPWVTEEQYPQLTTVLAQLSLCTKSLRPYIGMSSETYSGILEYCQTYGIKQFKNTTLPIDTIKHKIAHAREVILLSTTGASLIKALCTEAFPTALDRGCRISVLIPNQYSDFCEDVAEIERPDAKAENLSRLAQEYESVMVYLKDAIAASGQEDACIHCYCSHTLLRQTILLVKDRDDSVWSWVSLTMPPKRTVDGTPSFEVEGKLEPGHMVNLLWQHCQAIMRVSEQRHSCFTVGEESGRPFYKEDVHAETYWQERYRAANKTMEDRRDQYDFALIEVAAQHPLKRRQLPGEEFKRRLDTAIRVYEELQEDGIDAHFYVPGSRHCHNGVADKVSLSHAGKTYLMEHGIPEELIFGDDANEKYKGEDGVYNSADECYVASRLFLEGEYDRLICVCSPNQILRKTLFYVEFGVLPQCYGIPAEHLYHNVLDELFHSLPRVLYRDHSWQDPNGEAFGYFREQRKPKEET